MIHVDPKLLADPFDPNTFDPELLDDACFIHLSDRIDCYAIVDRQDYEWARHLKWCHTYGSGKMLPVANGVYAIQNPDHIYARNCAGGETRFLHREILVRWKGYPRRPGMIGDHKNGKTLDCRRKNLRWATKSQNAKNIAGSKIRARYLRIDQ
ncbi:hypothetical protein WYO_0170 [Methylobacterium sp. GXF4]|uniref:HNH endonuclease n=1 Tax=Methylobacterium sp. GXF4 TaxID=1096546 RepID=UPI0002698C53|nr:HNH endonuclease [Methylobacterium sp. GXF4]EIZ87133.1 hypothetical protein WYO_0170 [Methylobacterium sp. GXF4]